MPGLQGLALGCWLGVLGCYVVDVGILCLGEFGLGFGFGDLRVFVD